MAPILLCPWESAKFLIYSSNVPQLLFYSHVPSMIISLIFGFVVFSKSKKSKMGFLMFFVSFLFSLWCFLDLILWATNRPDMVIFFWSLQILIEPLVYLISFYLSYLFINNRDMPFKDKLLSVLLYLPVIIFLASKYNILGVYLSDCTALENIIARYFSYAVELIFVISILFLFDREYIKKINNSRRSEILTFTMGILLFLLAFSWGNLMGSFTDNWTIAQFGLIGMPIFIGILTYSVVRFHSFSVKIFTSQILVWALAILIGSQFFFIKVHINFILNGITFISTIIFGYLLVKSVKKEVEQREELSRLNINLQNLIKQRESLVHLVTHKVKGSFTRSKYIFAGIVDGTFGEANDDIKKYAAQGLESDNMGIETVDLVLNADNLQKGAVKYEMKNLDMKELVLKTLMEKRIQAEARGLKIDSEIKDGGEYHVMGDAFWLKEAINNLIENSIKYTKHGEIKIGLEDGNGKVRLYVRDTGIGITEEDKKNLFTEGGRGKDSVKVNVDSTGYGLYSVKLIVDAHKGKVWGESEGEGKGSTFYIELEAAK